MKYISNAKRNPDSPTVALLRLLLEEEGSEVSDVSLFLDVGPEYRVLVENSRTIVFPIRESSEWHAGRAFFYFSLHGSTVTEKLRRAILGTCDVMGPFDELPPDIPISAGIAFRRKVQSRRPGPGKS